MNAKNKIIKELDEIQSYKDKVQWWDVADVIEGYEEQLIDEGESPEKYYQIMLDMYVNTD
jgi:hypothetical protein